MKRKNEPLKGKVEEWYQTLKKFHFPNPENFADEIIDDIKSAIQGLLEDIERQDNEVTKILSEILQGNVKEKAVNRGALYGWREALCWIREKIKKWFPDVVKEVK